MRRPVTHWIVVTLVAMAVAALFYACGDDGSSPTRPKDGVVRLEAETFRYSPNDILLRPGESAVFEITSMDVGHTFTIDDLGLNSEIAAGQTITVELTATEEKTYTFYCAVPGHREQGMEGVVIVSRERRTTSPGGGSSGGGGGY